MLKNINIMLLEEQFSSDIEINQIHSNIFFHCTSDPLKAIGAVSRQEINFLIVSDSINSLDTFDFINLIQSISPNAYLPVYLKTDNLSDSYYASILEAGYIDKLPSSMKMQEIYVRLSLMIEQHTPPNLKTFNSCGDLEEQIIPENTSGLDNKFLLGDDFFQLQQPLPSIQSVPSYDYNLVKLAIGIIKRDHAITPSMDQLVQEIGVSKSTLTNAFMRIYKCSIFAWIREEKLLISKLLVINRIGNISDISERLGYADAAHFSRSFKHRFGCSPKKLNNANSIS